NRRTARHRQGCGQPPARDGHESARRSYARRCRPHRAAEISGSTNQGGRGMSRAQEARDRAALWVVAREQDDWNESDQAALDAWLAESDMNKAAYWRLDHSWREADRIGALG